MSVVLLKVATMIMHIAIKNQLMIGIYIWPMNFFEVCIIFIRGKQPRAMDCLMQENVADIMA